MHWLSIMPVTHVLKPTFQNKLSHFFGYSSRLEKLGTTNQPSCDLEDLQPISRTSTEPVRKSLQPISEQSTALGGALQPLSEASTDCGNGLQLISDAATALA
jgi:hypothetical protein